MNLELHKKSKIVVVGCAGSGKTYVATALHKKLGIPVIHLDQYHWEPGWIRADKDLFYAIQEELCQKEAWIMERAYISFLYSRVEYADGIIFLDMPRLYVLM